MCFWMFECNQCVLERLFQKTACLVWKFGCGSAHALVSQPQMGRRGACLHLPQECMTYMNMVGGGGTVEWCIIATDLHCLTRGGVDVNKKKEKYLLNGSSAVEEIISSEETQSELAVNKRGMESFNKRNWKTVLFRGMIWVCITPKLSPVDWR